MHRYAPLVAVALAAAAPSCSSEKQESRPSRTTATATIDDTTAIGQRYARLAGSLGAPASDELPTPDGAATYQRFENGAIVSSQDYGAVVLSIPLLDKWLSLYGGRSATGQELLGFVGVPTADYASDARSQRAPFVRGMIFVEPAAGTAFLVSGPLYGRYLDVSSTIGLPLGEEQPVPGGVVQRFENGNVYWRLGSRITGVVEGEIRERYDLIGGVTSQFGFPTSVARALLSAAGTPGLLALFENGALYSSPRGTFEVAGAVRTAYDQLGGAGGALGFPIGPPGATANTTFSDFENGVVVSHATWGTWTFLDLWLHWGRMSGKGSDLGGFGGAQDVYMYTTILTPDRAITQRYPPGSGNSWSGGGDVNVDVLVASAAHSSLSIDVSVVGREKDGFFGGDDDDLGYIHRHYTVDDLFGLMDAGPHTEGKFTVAFGVKNPIPYDTTDYDGAMFWSFQNFGTPVLTYDQYAATFRDVAPAETWFWHPFNKLLYELVYKGLAGGGNCYGMSLEAIYAQVGLSLYAEPIHRFYPDTQGGPKPDPTNPLHRVAINEINVKHGYQIGGESIDWIFGEIVSGATHDPVGVFRRARASFAAGNYPVISIANGYFGNEDGHAVRPYRFDDSDPSHWKMYVADPNYPTGSRAYQASGERFISIFPSSNTFRYDSSVSSTVYTGGEWAGGRMFQTPFHVVSMTPRLPFAETVLAVAAGTSAFFLVADAGETQQITDDAGRLFYEPGLGRAPERWDEIRRDDASRIPDLARIPLFGATGDRSSKTELYYAQAQDRTIRYEVAPAQGTTAGAPYAWAFHSPTLSAIVIVPGTPGASDVIAAREIGTPRKSVAVTPSRHKRVSWTMAGASKGRWARLDDVEMSAGQTIAVRLTAAGAALQFENDGAATTGQLTVKGGPNAPQVFVGTIEIPGGTTANGLRFDAPRTTFSIIGGTPGEAGWYVTPVAIGLSALDFSGTGIAAIEYRLGDRSWTTYPGGLMLADEGATTLWYRSADNTGAVEAARGQELRIDTLAPTASATVDRPAYERTDPFVVHFAASDPAPGSGLSTVTADLDGVPVTEGQEIDLLWTGLGTRTLTVRARDVAGWSITRTATFELVATASGIEATIERLAALGEIEPGIVKSLAAKARAAQGPGAAPWWRSQPLRALLNELRALRGKGVSARAADLLAADVEYARTHAP